MRFAIVGCGYVADYYMSTLPNHAGMSLAGVFDGNPAASARFSARHGATVYPRFENLLRDPAVGLVLNLTNPSSHYAVTKACLDAGRHVYSEKPLAMKVEDAADLVATAKRNGVVLSGAPCSVLGACAAKVREVVASGAIGTVRLVYAEMEDSMVFAHGCEGWTSLSGARWPYADEFAVGCTLEHAGYQLTWLCALFGPVEHMTAFASTRYPDKGLGVPPSVMAADFSVTCLGFADGVVARLTCGLVAPKDRSLHIIGDRGILSVTDVWDHGSPIHLRPSSGSLEPPTRVARRMAARIEQHLPLRHWFGRRIRPDPWRAALPKFPSRIDFMAGPAALAAAVAAGQTPLLSADFVLHVTEIAIVAQNAGRYAMPYRPTSRFDPALAASMIPSTAQASASGRTSLSMSPRSRSPAK